MFLHQPKTFPMRPEGIEPSTYYKPTVSFPPEKSASQPVRRWKSLRRRMPNAHFSALNRQPNCNQPLKPLPPPELTLYATTCALLESNQQPSD